MPWSLCAIAQLEFHENDGDLVASVISEWSGIPMGKLETKETDRLNVLGRRVKGQARAIRGVAGAIRRARAGLRDPNRPVQVQRPLCSVVPRVQVRRSFYCVQCCHEECS